MHGDDVRCEHVRGEVRRTMSRDERTKTGYTGMQEGTMHKTRTKTKWIKGPTVPHSTEFK